LEKVEPNILAQVSKSGTNNLAPPFPKVDKGGKKN